MPDKKDSHHRLLRFSWDNENWYTKTFCSVQKRHENFGLLWVSSFSIVVFFFIISFIVFTLEFSGLPYCQFLIEFDNQRISLDPGGIESQQVQTFQGFHTWKSHIYHATTKCLGKVSLHIVESHALALVNTKCPCQHQWHLLIHTQVNPVKNPSSKIKAYQHYKIRLLCQNLASMSSNVFRGLSQE